MTHKFECAVLLEPAAAGDDAEFVAWAHDGDPGGCDRRIVRDFSRHPRPIAEGIDGRGGIVWNGWAGGGL